MPSRIRILAPPLAWLLLWAAAGQAAEVSEYKLKAAYLYNFAAFTEWPADTPSVLQLCIHGRDPFGADLAQIEGKQVGGRTLAIRPSGGLEGLKGCQLVYIAPTEINNLARILDVLRGRPVLTVADSDGAVDQGVGINMSTVQRKVSFQVNLGTVRRAGLNLSSKLLRLATEVRQ
jgi:hypothetical protein